MADTNGNGVSTAERNGGGIMPAGDMTPVRVNGQNEAVRGRTQLMAHLSQIIDRTRFLERLGWQYQGQRDIYTVAGYPRELFFSHYYAQYRRGGLAGRVVDMAAQTTWRTPPDIVEPGMDPEKGTVFTQAFNSLAKRLRLWSMFEKVDRLSGIGRYGVLFIGVPGDDENLLREMPQLRGPQDVLFLSAFHEKTAYIRSWVLDPREERFGRPASYQLDFSSSTGSFPATSLPTDASRIIHVAEDKLDDHVYGRPRLERVYNYFMDLDKITAATGESFWQLAARILSAKTDAGVELSDEEIQQMSADMEAIIHDLRRIFIAEGVEAQWLQSTPPDPSKAADLIMTLIAGATGYPKRILFGSETGERASDQDQRHFFGLINERQERFAEPDIVRAFIDRLVQYGGLPKPKKDYEVQWPALYELTDQEKADANLARANTAKALTAIGGDPMQLVEVDSELNVWLKPTRSTPEGTDSPPIKGVPGDSPTIDEPQPDSKPTPEAPKKRREPKITDPEIMV